MIRALSPAGCCAAITCGLFMLAIAPQQVTSAGESCVVSDLKIALHLTSPPAKVNCGLTTAINCSQFGSQVQVVTHGSLNVEYRMYMLATNWQSEGRIAQLNIGIDYYGEDGVGVDIVDYHSCADFDIPVGDWPSPGSRLLMDAA